MSRAQTLFVVSDHVGSTRPVTYERAVELAETAEAAGALSTTITPYYPSRPLGLFEFLERP